MTDEDDPMQRFTVDEPVDLRTALETAGIESLDVDEHRLVVIYRSAILMVIITDGQPAAAQAAEVELWEPPDHNLQYDPDDFLTTFIDEVLGYTDQSRR